MQKNGWWDKIPLSDFFEIFEMHKKDFGAIYGEFQEYKSFEMIIREEFKRWQTTDDE